MLFFGRTEKAHEEDGKEISFDADNTVRGINTDNTGFRVGTAVGMDLVDIVEFCGTGCKLLFLYVVIYPVWKEDAGKVL